LFSKDSVADFVNRNFEPAWVSVRPVPVVRIDFGDGHVLTRTLHGNILTSVCDADGRVLDALPGIYMPDAYVDRLNQLQLLSKYVAKLPAGDRGDWLRGWHERQAASLKKDETPEQFAERRKTPPITKRLIETPVELVLLPAGSPPEKLPPAKADAKADPADPAGWKELAEDTKVNETTRRRQIHELLAAAGPVAPEKVTRPIYKDVLHADLDDPYLGLGKVLFDNYPFAKEDEGR
jgi:hypothetical protein